MNPNPPFTIQPDWKTLELRAAGVPGHAQALLRTSLQTMLVRPDVLPFADAQFDYITCTGAFGVDLYALVMSCEQALKPGGWLMVSDLTVPEDSRAAFYVNALYRFRDPREQTHYADYEWRGVFLDVGLEIEQCSVSDNQRCNVFAPELNLSDYQIERLHILLKQAPTAVAEFLQPFAVGSMDALISQPELIIYGQKPV